MATRGDATISKRRIGGLESTVTADQEAFYEERMRRERAFQWHARWAMPNYDQMIENVKKAKGLDITVADVDLLPWGKDRRLNRKEYVAIQNGTSTRDTRKPIKDFEQTDELKRMKAEAERLEEEAEQRRKEEEAEKRRKAAEDAQQRLKDFEEESRRRREEEERLRKEQEERLRREEEERRRKLEEEKRRLEEERRRKEEEERRRKAEEERRRLEEERRRLEEEKRKLEEERRRLEEEERRRREEEAEKERLRKLEEERLEQERLRKAEEERRRKEAEERRRKEEEERRRKEAEERRRQEEERRRQEEERRRQEEERRRQEEERRRLEELEKLRKAEEERKRREEEERRRKEEEERRRKEEEERRRREAEEAERKRLEEAERKRKEAERERLRHTPPEITFGESPIERAYRTFDYLCRPSRDTMQAAAEKTDGLDIEAHEVGILPWNPDGKDLDYAVLRDMLEREVRRRQVGQKIIDLWKQYGKPNKEQFKAIILELKLGISDDDISVLTWDEEDEYIIERDDDEAEKAKARRAAFQRRKIEEDERRRRLAEIEAAKANKKIVRPPPMPLGDSPVEHAYRWYSRLSGPSRDEFLRVVAKDNIDLKPEAVHLLPWIKKGVILDFERLKELLDIAEEERRKKLGLKKKDEKPKERPDMEKRKENAYKWYKILKKPKQATMYRLQEQTLGTDMMKSDIDLLPWDDDGHFVDEDAV